MAIRNGTNQRDTLYGTDENDELYGFEGNDYLSAGAGNDTIDGGLGADFMVGGAGSDVYYVDNAGDQIVEYAGEGTYDVVYSTVSYTLSSNVEQLFLQESGGAINGYGSDTGNSIFGNSYANVIYGWGGNDTLNGGAGNDELRGGAGHDLLRGDEGDDIMIGGADNDGYNVDSAGDLVIEYAGEGTDYVSSTISYTLGANVEELFLRGSGNISGTGNELDNRLFGNSGNNVLNGGAGADVMAGGTGSDTYYVDNAGDLVSENANAGHDKVNASVSYTLGANVENLLLTGSAAINGTGNELNNHLWGNGANNTLIGGAGNDLLQGRGGTDTMIGGTGDDWFYIDSADDVVQELAGEGYDALFTSISHTLEENFEVLVLQSEGGAINGYGNGLNNEMYGNGSDNRLNGLWGDDTISGGGGNDTLLGGSGWDTLNGDAGDDVLVGGSNMDVLIGGSGADAFVFALVSDSPVSAALGDEIRDFSSAQGDFIDLSVIDARSDVSGNQAFSYLGDAAFSGTAGELRFAGGLLEADTDGNGSADFRVQVTGVTSLSAGDFLL
jgi:Ca2+-binding RTX toxin-like protein